MKLYELRGLGDVRYSTFAWRSRMALLHKGLDFERQGVAISDKESIAFSGQKNVPILIDGDAVIVDSWRIAEHLEDAYPERPSLFGGQAGRRFARFVNQWADGQVLPALFPPLAVEVTRLHDAADEAHFRGRMERFFGKRLEEVAADRDARIHAFRKLLAPARDLVQSAPFLGGAEPLYPDYVLFGVFIWSRLVSTAEVLAGDDPLHAWFERMLDLFDGEGRAQPAAGAA